MQVIEKSVSDLKMYEKNPRKNDSSVDAVAESIKEFGFKVPIVIDKNDVIVTGHTRYKACLKLGLKTVPCIVADDLNEEQIKAFRLADNKTSELSSWDYTLLDTELDDIFNIDMKDFGFINFEINWDEIEEVSKENYEKPTSDKLRCPICGGVDEKIRFVKVNE